MARRPCWSWLIGLLCGWLWLSGCQASASVALGNAATTTPAPSHSPDHAAPHALPAAPSTFSSTLAFTVTLTPSATPTASATRRPTRTPRPSATPTASVVPSPTALSSSARQHIFEKVWQTIDEHYLYADFRGVDWDEVWNEFAPQVKAAQSNEEFYQLMTAMVDRLEDQHSRFLAPSDAVQESALSVGHGQHVGIGVITAPSVDGAVIQHVFSDSPAARAGLRPRDRIVAIDGAPFAVGRDITGREGTSVRLTVLRPDKETRDVVLTRQHVEGKISPTASRLPGDIGYLAISTLWVSNMADQVSGALTDLVVERPLKGLILDLRGNPGGWRDVLTSVLGHFVQGDAGYFYDRQHTRPLIIRESSGPDLRDLPLAVLIDEQTASYAEVLTAILQAEAGAYVIGAPSSGNTETIYAYELSGGARLWVAQEGFRLRNGTNLEGHGVQPDVVLDLDWTRYSQEKDPHILEALRYLKNRSPRSHPASFSP